MDRGMAHLRIHPVTFDTELYRTLHAPVSGGGEREEVREVRGTAAKGVARIAHEEREQHGPDRDEKLRLNAFHEEVINEELNKRGRAVARLERVQEDLPHRDMGEYAGRDADHQHRLNRQKRRNALPEPNAIHAPHDAALEVEMECGGVNSGHAIYEVNLFLNTFRARKSFIFRAPTVMPSSRAMVR